MNLKGTLRKEFSFIGGNYATIVISWILIDFAGEIPATYYALYVLKLGATETILGVIFLWQFTQSWAEATEARNSPARTTKTMGHVLARIFPPCFAESRKPYCRNNAYGQSPGGFYGLLQTL